MRDDPVFITAQEAAERLLTIKIAGCLFFALIVFALIWIFIMWKHSEERRKIEAQNDRDRISVTRTIGKSLADALKDDGNWKEQFIILKRKYDALEAHCENMEDTLDKAKGSNNFGRGADAK